MIKPRNGDSLIVAHARRELEMSGAFDTTDDWDGNIGRGILALVKTFDQRSEGKSASMQIIHQTFNSLVAGDLLVPPTTDPDEWEKIERDDQTVYRNKRSPFYVTNDLKFRTWTNIATKEKGMCRNHKTGEDPEEPDEIKRENAALAGAAVGNTDADQVADTSDGRDDKETGKPASDAGSSEAAPDAEGHSVDSGVASKGKKDQSKPKKSTRKPKGGKKK